MLKDLLQKLSKPIIDCILLISLGTFVCYIFIGIIASNVVYVYEDNWAKRIIELGIGVGSTIYGIFRLGSVTKFFIG